MAKSLDFHVVTMYCLNMARFVVDVMLSTHDGLKEGVLAMDWHRTIVEAVDGFEAEQTAYLMAHCQGWYPTSVCIIEDGTDEIANGLV